MRSKRGGLRGVEGTGGGATAFHVVICSTDECGHVTGASSPRAGAGYDALISCCCSSAILSASDSSSVARASDISPCFVRNSSSSSSCSCFRATSSGRPASARPSPSAASPTETSPVVTSPAAAAASPAALAASPPAVAAAPSPPTASPLTAPARGLSTAPAGPVPSADAMPAAALAALAARTACSLIWSCWHRCSARSVMRLAAPAGGAPEATAAAGVSLWGPAGVADGRGGRGAPPDS
eukprot:scaffold2297_cov102-Isochrysis_galbana.AAC.13